MPSYALIVRENYPAREAGARVSLVLMTTVAGMAITFWLLIGRLRPGETAA